MPNDAEREKYRKQAEEARAKLDEAERYLKAYAAFDAVLEGKDPTTAEPKAPRATGAKQGRVSRSGVREAVLAAIRNNPTTGLTSKQIEERLQAQGMDAKSLANLLVNLKKQELITQEKKRAPFFPATPGAPQTSEEAA